MSRRLSAVDAAFLNAEGPDNPMHIGGLLVFRAQPEVAGRPGLDSLFETIEHRLPLIPRIRQVLVPVPFGLGTPVWADSPNFDIRRHLKRVRLRPPGDRGRLLEAVAKLHARHLDRAKPLWEIYLIDGLAEDRVAVYAKLHHAMADGISAVELALVLLDLDPIGELAPEIPAAAPAQEAPRTRDLLLEGPRQAAEEAAVLFRRATAQLPWPIGEPQAMAGAAAAAVRGTVAGFEAAMSLRELSAMLRPAPATPFNQRIGGRRRIEAVQLPLGAAKDVKNALGGTVNDVILATVAEALHLFLDQRGEDSDGLFYRVMVPISVRAESEKLDLGSRHEKRLDMGNRIVGTFVDLPVGPMSPARRLWVVRQAMGKVKTGQADAAGRFLDLASLSPAAVQRATLRAGLANQRLINLVVSNVPGVQLPVYAGGSRALEMYPTLPLTPNTGLIICVLSYDNNLHFGLVGDPDLVPDMDVFAADLRLAFQRLRRAATAGTSRGRSVGRAVPSPARAALVQQLLNSS
jgi:diacylglycerol O-acyltransferase